MRKLISLILALMLVFSMSAIGFADATETKITVPDDGHTYEVYQIFKATLTEVDGKLLLTDVKWGRNGKDVTEDTPVSQDVLDELKKLTESKDNMAKLEVITNYVTLSNPVATIGKAADNQEKKLSAVVTPGYYLVKDKDGSVTGNDFYTTYIVEVVDSVTITRKGDVPKVEKKIVVDDNKVVESEASIGETIRYEFIGTLPTNIAEYNTYFYKFTDTMDKGLDYVGNLKVTVNDVDVTKYFFAEDKENKTNNVKNSTTLVVGIDDLLMLDNDMDPNTEGHQYLTVDGKTMTGITAATKVVVSYDAKLNKNAIVGTSGNKNSVLLRYDNNPNDDGVGNTTPPPENPEKEPETTNPTGTTPPSEVWTYTTEIIIKKVDQNNNILTGAEFTITGKGVHQVVTSRVIYEKCAKTDHADCGESYWLLKDGTYTTQDPDGSINDVPVDTNLYVSTSEKYHAKTELTVQEKTTGTDVKAYVDHNGQVKFTGLGEGEYTIKESVVPAGYNSIPDFTVTITWDDAEDKMNDCTWKYEWSNDTENETNTTTIQNQVGSTLPETGGTGTTVMYVIGGIMVLAAVVLLVTKKRMASES